MITLILNTLVFGAYNLWLFMCLRKTYNASHYNKPLDMTPNGWVFFTVAIFMVFLQGFMLSEAIR